MYTTVRPAYACMQAGRRKGWGGAKPPPSLLFSIAMNTNPCLCRTHCSASWQPPAEKYFGRGRRLGTGMGTFCLHPNNNMVSHFGRESGIACFFWASPKPKSSLGELGWRPCKAARRRLQPNALSPSLPQRCQTRIPNEERGLYHVPCTGKGPFLLSICLHLA